MLTTKFVIDKILVDGVEETLEDNTIGLEPGDSLAEIEDVLTYDDDGLIDGRDVEVRVTVTYTV